MPMLKLEPAVVRNRKTVDHQDQRAREFSLVTEVAEMLWSSLDIDQALQRALNRVGESFGASWAAVHLEDQAAGKPLIRAQVGPVPFEVMRNGAGALRDLRADLLIGADATVGAQITGGVLPETWHCRRLAIVPIKANDRALGSISLASNLLGRFSSGDEATLTAVGRVLGAAVAHSQLYQRVRRAKMEWESASDAIGDSIALFNRDRRTMRVNLALAQLRGWKITETQGRTCDEVGFCGGGCPDCLVGEALRDGKRLDRELVTAEGRIIAVTMLPVPGPDRTVVQVAKDVTDERHQARRLRELSADLQTTNGELVFTLDRLRKAQTQLIQSEKLSAMGVLVAGVAHEINNPLTTISGYGQLVMARLSDDPAFDAAADVIGDDVACIVSECDRAAKIVRNMLSFARLQPSEPTQQSLADLCQRVVALRAYDHRKHNVDMVCSFADDLPPVWVDAGQIQQVLLNLMVNAEQAMKDRAEKRLELSVRVEPTCGAVRIEVRDTGSGIDPDNIRRIFDPFFTTKSVGEGTGLGLSIVYGIVRDHGGQISVDSELSVGTTFSVRLPIRSTQSGTIALVACAEAVNRDFLSAVFRGWGFDVRTASTTFQALDELHAPDVTLLCLDDLIVASDPARWREAWAPVADRVWMVGIASRAGDEAQPLLRESARVMLAAPDDLCQIRAALSAQQRGEQ